MNNELEKQINYATALVHFTGLGMVCANEPEEKLETMFIHAKKHKLNIEISKVTKIVDGRVEEQEFMNSLTYEDFLLEQNFWHHSQIKISISSELGKSSKYRGLSFYTPGDFDRSEKSNRNDFRWLINLNKDRLLGEEEMYDPVPNNDFPRSLLTIENCLLYTDKLAVDDNDREVEFLHVVDRGEVPYKNRSDFKEQKFGKVADTLGAAVFGSLVNVKIEFDGKIHNFHLPKTENPYLIKITNVAKDMDSDMDVYRTFWALEPSDIKFNLLVDDEIDKLLGRSQGGTVGARKTCALARIERPSGDDQKTSIADFMYRPSYVGEK